MNEAKDGFIPEARADILSPGPTTQKLVETRGVEAPGHIARPGVADAMYAHFEETHADRSTPPTNLPATTTTTRPPVTTTTMPAKDTPPINPQGY